MLAVIVEDYLLISHSLKIYEPDYKQLKSALDVLKPQPNDPPPATPPSARRKKRKERDILLIIKVEMAVKGMIIIVYCEDYRTRVNLPVYVFEMI